MENKQELINKMTFEEKAMLLTGGAVLSTCAIERLGISSVNMSDGPHGVRRLVGNPTCPQDCNIKGGDACYPTASAVGSSWNPELAYNIGAAIARDCIAEGVDVLLAPAINMKRTPKCGRNFEYYSEDPYLSGILGAAFVNGVQDSGVGTSVKHYAANNQEFERGTINAEIDERTLREYYLKEFEVLLQNCNPTSVMCAYNKLNGIWCSENKFLLTDILKKEWGYDGLVVSDWGAVHDICLALNAGLDLEMPQNDKIAQQLKKGIEKGRITEATLDRALISVLNFVDKVKSLPRSTEPYDRSKQHETAYEAACEAITLLKNDGDVLPVTPDKYKRIAIIGKSAENPSFMGGGSSCVSIEKNSVDIPLDFIRKNSGDSIEITYVPEFAYGQDFMKSNSSAEVCNAAGNADLTIIFVSDNFGLESETEELDRQNLMFPNHVNFTIELACKKCENVVVVMQNGSAVLPFHWQKKVKGIIEMWYSGEAGGRAIADILFGKVNPSGKISETFMLEERCDLDYPGNGRNVCYKEGCEVGYRYYDKRPDKVWYPFGHGISYTSYEYSDLSVDVSRSNDEYTVTVRMSVKNTGKTAGKEVVQLYVQPVSSVVSRPTKELKGFKKVFLDVGEEKTIEFTLNNHDFEYYNLCLRKWYLETGKYNIIIGASSADIRLQSTIVLYNDNGYTTDGIAGDMVL